MALKRLAKDEVYRLGLASPLAFDTWEQPTVAEMNAWNSGPVFNDPSGLIWNLSCALNTDGTQFDLDDPDLDDSLTFCQTAGNGEVMTENATVVYEFERSKGRWLNAASTTVPADPAADGFNTANLALSLMAWRGVEYFAILSVGEAPDAPFTAGDRIKMAYVVTDHGVDEIGTGENTRMTQTFGARGRVNWNKTLTA